MSGSITRYETANGIRWRVRYRKPDKSQTDKRGFKTKKEASDWLARTTVSKSDNAYIDPQRSGVTVGDLAETWLKSKKLLKPSAYAELPRAWRLHVQPVWSHRKLREILPSEVQSWLTDMHAPDNPNIKAKSASTTLRALGVLAGILDMAVKDKRLVSNPARGLETLPKKPKKKTGVTYLTHDQLHRFATESSRPALVLFLGYTGLRWGEATALRLRSVNMLRRRVTVEESATYVDGVLDVGEPKDWEKRSVPFPSFLALQLAAEMEGKGPDDLVFGDGSTYLSQPRFGNGWFDGAISRLQATDKRFPRITPHDLRHTAASLAVASGANVKALQRMLGHASAAMTLDTYADLFDEDLDKVAERLEEAARAESVGKVWAKALG